MTTTEAYDCVKEHLTVAIQLRLFEIKESEAIKTLNLINVSEEQVKDAASSALGSLLNYDPF